MHTKGFSPIKEEFFVEHDIMFSNQPLNVNSGLKWTIGGGWAALTGSVAGFSGQYSWPGVATTGGSLTTQRSLQGEKEG